MLKSANKPVAAYACMPQPATENAEQGKRGRLWMDTNFAYLTLTGTRRYVPSFFFTLKP